MLPFELAHNKNYEHQNPRFSVVLFLISHYGPDGSFPNMFFCCYTVILLEQHGNA